MSSSRAKKDVPSGCKLQPSIVQDSIGPHIIVTCANLSGKLYLLKLDESKKPLPKCVLINGSWFSPSEVESLAGKKAKKWKQSLQHLDKPLSHYILSCSSVSLSQQSISANNANRDVVDNTGVSQSGSSQASLNPSASVSSGLNTPISQAQQQGSFTATTKPNAPLVDTVLSFIAAYRLKGDTDSLKKIVVERFCNDDVEAAKRLLWDSCSSHLLAKGLVFHTRRDSDRRSQLEAHLDDIIHAFDVLDSSDSIPTICCEASSLHRIPPLSLDPVAEQVHSNSQALRALSSVIECLEKKLSSFLVSGVSSPVTSGAPPGVSYAAAASSDSPGDSHHPPVTSRKVYVSPRSFPSTDDRSCNVILFGLPEGRSLVESKMLVDEVLEFLSGKHIPIKDVFRLGKYVQPSASSHPRPILIKLCTAWDRKLVLLHKTSLKTFRIKSLFLREDVSPDHKLRSRKPKPSVESHSGDSSQAHSASAASHFSPSSKAQHTSAPDNSGSLSSATCDMASMSVSTMPVRAMSQPLSSPPPSPSSVAVIRGSLDDSHGSA